MVDHPDDEKLNAAHAAMAETRRRRQRSGVIELSLVAGAAVLVTCSTAFSAWNTFELRKLQRAQVEERQIIRLGTECMVEQLSEHRHLNALGHRADAGHHGYSYPIDPGSEPPVVPGVLEQVCQMFLQTTTTSRP